MDHSVRPTIHTNIFSIFPPLSTSPLLFFRSLALPLLIAALFSRLFSLVRTFQFRLAIHGTCSWPVRSVHHALNGFSSFFSVCGDMVVAVVPSACIVSVSNFRHRVRFFCSIFSYKFLVYLFSVLATSNWQFDNRYAELVRVHKEWQAA